MHYTSACAPRFRRAFALVEILVVLLLLLFVAGTVSYFYLGKGGAKAQADHTPISEANAAVCRSNLVTVRQSVAAAMATETDGKYPASLNDLHLPSECLQCPVGHEPYVYDPATGQVHCVHPGHESF